MKRLLYILTIAAVTFAGCKKSERDDDILTNTSEENALAEAIYADAFRIVHRAALNTKGISAATETDSSLFGCDQIITDTNTFPKAMFIDFRFTGCVATFGVPRKGRIIAEFTGVYPDSNSIINIRFLNYSFGDFKVDGNISIVNRGRNEDGNRTITFFLQDGTITGDIGTIMWQGNKSWELIKGASTATLSDDEYRVTGTSFGFNSNGNEFDTEVTTDNIVQDGCFQIVQGVQQVNIKNLSQRIMNYGSGSCDRKAVVNINGEDYDITLRQ